MIEKAYAKINLTLEVIGKTNNFHLLESIVIPINVYDTLKFEESDIDIVVSNVEIKDNNIYQAINLFKETFKIEDHVKITLDKNIPIGYGIGGSSADISATLRGLNKFFNVNKSLKDLEPLANKLGSDTLFCLYNKRAYIYGRGDKIKFIKTNDKLNFLIIYPEVSLLTKDVFMNFDFNKNKQYIGFLNQGLDFILSNLKNDLLIPAVHISEELNYLYQELKDNGLNVNLTGSGPALFIVNPTKDEVNKVKQILNNKTNFIITKEI